MVYGPNSINAEDLNKKISLEDGGAVAYEIEETNGVTVARAVSGDMNPIDPDSFDDVERKLTETRGEEVRTRFPRYVYQD